MSFVTSSANSPIIWNRYYTKKSFSNRGEEDDHLGPCKLWVWLTEAGPTRTLPLPSAPSSRQALTAKPWTRSLGYQDEAVSPEGPFEDFAIRNQLRSVRFPFQQAFMPACHFFHSFSRNLCCQGNVIISPWEKVPGLAKKMSILTPTRTCHRFFFSVYCM